MKANKSLVWVRTPTGNLMSAGTRFLIEMPEPIDARTISGGSPETRTTLIDRIGSAKKGFAKKVKYLCLSVVDAQALANDINNGVGPLERIHEE